MSWGPGRIVEITDPANYLAKVDISGVQRTISVRLLEDDMPSPTTGYLSMSALRWPRSTRPRRCSHWPPSRSWVRPTRVPKMKAFDSSAIV